MHVNLRRLLIVPAVAAGAGILFVMNSGREGAPRTPPQETATPVSYIRAQTQAVTPRALGNGSVRPARVWSAVSQVQGRVVELPAQYRVGTVVREGEQLLRIDDSDYKLALAQADATVLAIEAQLRQLQVQESNLRASLAIEQEVLNSAANELQRLDELAKQGTVATSDRDAQERVFLGQKQALQNLKNNLELLPSERAVLEAQLVQQRAQLAQAELDLQRTSVHIPFDARVAEMNVELDQYVRQNDVIAVLDDMGLAEVEAEFALEHFAQLVQPLDMKALIAEGEIPGPHLLNLQARVILNRNDGMVVEWPARFVRIDAAIDTQTRTVGAVVAVAEPYANARPPLRPPLVKGMYVTVELQGPAHQEQIAIPRRALHGDQVYVIAEDDRLERRRVSVFLRQPGLVTLRTGVTAGERVVVSDVIPAIGGMLLAPVEDKAAVEALERATSGSAG
ncbi:MAG: biotin/lipoyl-binding protein [Gammaproteobacteria bacterium]|nr:biotin/lipoyl-binding protein [Gammaproteobacteria bacterium]